MSKISLFQQGFPLEKPNVILAWNKPLSEVAQTSGGVWSSDRYMWKDVIYLNGLNYPLYSQNGLDPKTPFTSISAYIGLTPKGLWSDEVVLMEYKKVANRLIEFFGQPQKIELNPEVPGTETLTWQFDKVEVCLDVIEQFSYKCYLTIGIIK